MKLVLILPTQIWAHAWRSCSEAAFEVEGRSANEIFGSTDAMKLRSSMTLFKQVAGNNSIFMNVLEKYFDGESDRCTLEILKNIS